MNIAALSRLILLASIFLCLIYSNGIAQQSVARQWNEVLLDAIRVDYARPTVHARNLFHTSIALYDAWAVYDQVADTYFLGKNVGDYLCSFEGIPRPSDIKKAREEAMSYAVYRLLVHRFKNSPGSVESVPRFDQLMVDLGYDKSNTSVEYSSGSPSALGNYLAQQIIEFGLQDGSNEQLDYANLIYVPFNASMTPTLPGSQGITDPNRWQPLTFDFFIDQAGFEIPGGIPDFLGPEWGSVVPFSLSENELSIKNRDGDDYWVYHDPGSPAYLQTDGKGTSPEYQWGHSLVAIWSSHLDPFSDVVIDISPASIGNINIDDFPETIEALRDFYKLEAGGDPGKGYNVNPSTGNPYVSQIVPKADYARVLAEFWADGPDSETPPGHWFTILNYVNDHAEIVKKFKGEGVVLDDLEWDVKAYFLMGGAMHDAAVTAWGIKGWYDYIRPISAIRYMADQGQSTNSELANYSMEGMPLVSGLVEIVEKGDALAGDQNEHIGKIKLFAWKGPEYIFNPETDVAGVGWILAENWWPYQRPSFVTPPFAGYVSGHSTFSRAAAEIMTLLTGDEFFPGGMAEFEAKKNEFLVFEEGPSVDVVLQWAKYYDASDQCSLSRIWGGIHPPVDDIPGRLAGSKVGKNAFSFAEKYFDEIVVTDLQELQIDKLDIYPNPIKNRSLVTIKATDFTDQVLELSLTDVHGKLLINEVVTSKNGTIHFSIGNVDSGLYFVRVSSKLRTSTGKILITNN